MISGNVTATTKPTADELRQDINCCRCGGVCAEVAIDESYDDGHGTVEMWRIGSDCCGAECRIIMEDEE